MSLDTANLLLTLIHEQIDFWAGGESKHPDDVAYCKVNASGWLALLSIVELCNENTDHHLVDKSWILEAIEKEFR